jgi:hypothetical protein
MKTETFYAFHCSKKEEKHLMERVNNYLAGFDRTTSKTKNQVALTYFLPMVFKHFYWNLNKDTGTYFAIFPNEDSNGAFFFIEQPNLGWLMRVRIDIKTYPAATQEKAESFINGLLSAIGCNVQIFKEVD